MIDQEILITAVRDQRLLWDKRHKNYRNRLMTKKAWRHVAEKAACTSDEAQSKWKNLRDSYARELKKLPKKHPGAGDADPAPAYAGDWIYFEAMHFLQGVIRPRKKNRAARDALLEEHDTFDEESIKSAMSDSTATSSNADNQTRVKSEPETFPTLFVTELPCEPHQGTATPADDLLTPRYSTDRNTPVSQRDYSSLGISRTVEGDNANQSDFSQMFATLEREKLSLLKKKIDLEEDEDMNWFKSILPHLRTLPPLHKLMFRTTVQEMLFNEMTKLNAAHAAPAPSATVS